MTFALERKLNLEISNKNVKRRGFRIQIKCYFEVLYHLELNFFIKIQQDFLCAYRSYYNHLIRGSVLKGKKIECCNSVIKQIHHVHIYIDICLLNLCCIPHTSSCCKAGNCLLLCQSYTQALILSHFMYTRVVQFLEVLNKLS